MRTSRVDAAWHSKLDLLAYDLDGEKPPWQEVDHWRELWAAYIDRFGPEASALGRPEEWERAHGPATARSAEATESRSRGWKGCPRIGIPYP